ncbi:transcription elongation factor NusA [candidate division MSBL1 archaeon SCGC-AAA382M17]|uniref:Probable transcription termination protein NusA n=1 Tax=candidate division MSBL1 archaeon SCGC-AAA382M17 TaxID=1698284 RepID=A0ABR5TJE1_9EURY|nr:transcription elongation factor NusA [candidate division MSBL1 archaeon SCGC-AAA382M17]
MKVKLSNEKLRYIALFEKLTKVTPRDCVMSDNDQITFVVDQGDMGRAIGENGKNVSKVRKKLDSRVDVVEYSSDPQKFLKNIFSPAEVEEIEIEEEEDQKVAIVHVKESDKGRAVGRNGWNIDRARKLSSRHHGLSDVSIP